MDGSRETDFFGMVVLLVLVAACLAAFVASSGVG